MRQYIALYGNNTILIMAEDLYSAKLKAINEFKAPKSKAWMVSVHLSDRPIDTSTI